MREDCLLPALLEGRCGDGSGFGEANHVDCSFGSFGAFVAESSSGAVESLLLVVDGEHSEYYGTLGVEVELSHAFGHALAYVVEVGCIATDYASDYYYSVEQRLQACGGVGEFDSAGHFKHLVCDVAAFEKGCGALSERAGDVAVPAG